MDHGSRSAGGPGPLSSILVVDDEPASGELTAMLLRSQAYAVSVVTSAESALERVARGEVDVLVLDVMMAHVDGVEVCSYVRNELGDTTLPIVITTALQDRETRLRAKEAGADDVLVKPLDGLELLVRVESLLRRRAQFTRLVRAQESAREEAECARNERDAERARSLALVDARAVMRALVAEQQRLVVQLEPGAVDGDPRPSWQILHEVTEQLARQLERLSALQVGPDGESAQESCPRPMHISK